MTNNEMVPSLPHPARIIELTDESPTVRTFVLDMHLQARPGQFVMAWLPGVDEKPFSLVCGDPVILTICRVGPFTEQIFTLGTGNRLWIRGPLGQPFTLPPQPESRILLVAGGYGVAPLFFLARRAREAGCDPIVVIGARTASDVVLANRFASLGVSVGITTDDGSLGRRGLATDAAAQLLDESSIQSLYACGPEPMLDAVEALARIHRLPAQLSYERYMRCGFGVCGSCVREGWLVCRDGPVKCINP